MYKPLVHLADHIRDPCGLGLRLTAKDAEFLARDTPPEVRASALDFFHMVIELITRYGEEFTARNADLAVRAPEYRREHYFQSRSSEVFADQIKLQFESMPDPDNAVVDPDDTIVEFGVA